MSKPDIVFADEPTGNLDSRSGAEVLAFLRRSVDEFGQTIVMVTHDPVAAAYTDRVVFLADGEIVDELHAPTREDVLRSMGRLEPGGRHAPKAPRPEGRALLPGDPAPAHRASVLLPGPPPSGTVPDLQDARRAVEG
jgi:putative ABC transport system ATP-binding protein